MLLLTLASLGATVLASCECGYKTDENDVWQFSITTDFTSPSINSTSGFSANWQVTEAVQGDIADSSPYQRNYTTANVQLPHIGSSALTLLASAYTGPSGGAVQSGQITTIRSDILYGSFRSTFMVTGGSGACAGFFSYADDENENDIEVLTDEGTRQVHFSTQPIDSSGATVTMDLPDNAVTTSLQSYRFDWKSNAVTYFVNGELMSNITRHPSTEASQIIMNAWSNGGAFTGGPPTRDMMLSVKSITLYFNTSVASTVGAYERKCAAAGGKAVCSVDPVRSTDQSLSTTAGLVVSSTGAQATGLATRTASLSGLALFMAFMTVALSA
ncbi:putative Endo-1,3(4)-beta-glucanase [Taphrina deformans PYCC 5710]|uniref:Endo-1,3(4)-beta-glucanase n=1 Tax=Taphrina deformans (strain PYCC 5710 / ATCC 11124 / CBS 356.35 / IMI 108563 / JCM 9778 / NBRC 8474) TaxID=1097556 RepID=R4X859_TAPDE|nr:putative Endo-1,3(4)-beta-glucanase [Taphrina deformans PYCC 5710]|eukprot:CCG81709.1 putative Endo-1,3(4)-beta-glucanase [Taphrina deformans PYCC 5710]